MCGILSVMFGFGSVPNKETTKRQRKKHPMKYNNVRQTKWHIDVLDASKDKPCYGKGAYALTIIQGLMICLSF